MSHHVAMNILYPRIPLNRLAFMIRIALLGALVAGPYGAIHDQISYAISPEYFTKLKFRQFSYADFGWPPRLFAAEDGFLATWWVGLLSGWLLARAGLAEIPPQVRQKLAVRSFGIVIVVAAFTGLIGSLIGFVVSRRSDLSGWSDLRQYLNVDDLRAFIIVAYLHAAGYLGALVGLVAAVVYVRRCLAQFKKNAEQSCSSGLRSDICD